MIDSLQPPFFFREIDQHYFKTIPQKKLQTQALSTWDTQYKYSKKLRLPID